MCNRLIVLIASEVRNGTERLQKQQYCFKVCLLLLTTHTQSINLFAPERHNGPTDHEKPLVMVDGG